MPAVFDSAKATSLTVGLIVPDSARYRSLAGALNGSSANVVRMFEDYPSREDISKGGGLERCDVLIVDLDQELEPALRVIEDVCAQHYAVTVMAYSGSNDSNLMRRSMQAGAREFLIEPILTATLTESFARAYARRAGKERTAAKVMVFVPTKGGVGVTTLATNFALALLKESGARVVIVDMDFQLGEIALGLGLVPGFSVVDALVNASRLDREFLSTMLVRHASGLAVLAAPESYTFFHSRVDDGADKLFRILREEFDYVVVDTGTCHGHIQESLFGMAERIYLVTEMTFPALRNAHRVISYLGTQDGKNQVDVVLNRFNSRHGDIDEASAVKALSRPVNWRIPNAYAAARTAQDTGVPMALSDAPINRSVVEMAKAACGKPLTAAKATKSFNFFGGRTLSNPVQN